MVLVIVILNKNNDNDDDDKGSKKPSSSQSDSKKGNDDDDDDDDDIFNNNSGSNKPNQGEKPGSTSQPDTSGKTSLTVNGQKMDIQVSGYCIEDDDYLLALLIGEKGDNICLITIEADTAALSPNTSYTITEYTEDIWVEILYVNVATDDGVELVSYFGDFDKLEMKVGNFRQGGTFDFTLSGHGSDYGISLDFTANGTLQLYDYDELEELYYNFIEMFSDY